MEHDDEIVDAVIVDDDLLPVLAPSRELDDVSQVVDKLPPGALDLFMGPDVIAIPMDPAMRAQVRQALAFYWENGPRQRSTTQCKRAMDRISDMEPDIGHCGTCNGSGRFSDRLGREQVCSCPAALR